MKKLFLYVFLGLLLSGCSKEDKELSNFPIGGLIIGETLLKYMSEDKIIQNQIPVLERNTSGKFLKSIYTESSLTYDGIAVEYKVKDKKYIIQGIVGFINYDGNIENCYKKQDKIDKKISSKYHYINRKDSGLEKLNYGGDGSTFRSITYYLNNGGEMWIDCYYFTEGSTDGSLFETKFESNLKIIMSSKEMINK